MAGLREGGGKGKCGLKIKDKRARGSDDRTMADSVNPLRILIPEGSSSSGRGNLPMAAVR